MGYVGDVEAINPAIVERLLGERLIPVVSTIGADLTGQSYNFNADTAAAALAAALAAETIDEEGLAELRKVHARFLHAGSDGAALGPEDLQQLNHDFHRIINLTAPGRTRWLLRHLEHSVPSNYYEFADGWNHAAVEHHAAILEAIASGDTDGARRAMEAHLQASGEPAAALPAAIGFFGDNTRETLP
mgnify:CR=1 FL=1